MNSILRQSAKIYMDLSNCEKWVLDRITFVLQVRGLRTVVRHMISVVSLEQPYTVSQIHYALKKLEKKNWVVGEDGEYYFGDEYHLYWWSQNGVLIDGYNR